MNRIVWGQIVICVQQRYQPNPACCANNGSLELVPLLRQAIAVQHGPEVELVESGCMGMCQHGPNLKLLPDGLVWQGVQPSQVNEIVRLAGASRPIR